MTDSGQIAGMTRAELVAYLEGRGFAVYESESTEDLREAVRLDSELVDVGGVS
jgi:hypothetical protein